ncbi:MAG: hypothetical protein JWP66_483 [Naasia sp.]|nr:hypothetical protein [Naasia sp.]
MSNLGLLFDIDGPLASPVSRTIAIPSILDDLIRLAGAGVPIAFITGRSDGFVGEQVVAPLLARGIGAALMEHDRMFGVFEKSASWAPITERGLGELTVDTTVALPPGVVEEFRRLTEREFADTMFFDDTKHAMVSVEQLPEVSAERYRPEQLRFNEAAYDLMRSAGLGVRYGDREAPDAAGEVPFRLDPTIISTDVESVLLDKDRGANRALAYFAERGELPRRWRTIGDSRSDYKMADALHAAGFDVAHVDVRPGDGVPEKPYRVIIEGDLIHDEAGAAFLAHWTRELELP